jgi:NADPH-dependent ferric siderophore reductase
VENDGLRGPGGWNPGDRDRILIAGRGVEIPTIRFVLATLSAKSRGQVFIEVDSADEIETLDAPTRFAICWLVRDQGQELQRSVDAWLSEMLPVSGTQEHSVYAWFASDGVARVLSSDF